MSSHRLFHSEFDKANPMLALLESGVQMFSDVFSLGKALFSFHCAFKDSIDSLILGVFFARLCPYLLLVTCLQEKQKVLAKDAKGAKGKKPRGGKS
jgi:hypothetical protein